MTAVSPGLKAAIQGYLAGSEEGSLVASTRSMSQRYRQGGRSDSELDFRAYLVARLPATYAAVDYCLAELTRRHPQFTPQSVLDAGSGPGTAAWAASVAYPELSSFTFLDNNAQFLKLASSLAVQSDHPALQRARALNGDISSLRGLAADLVVAAYALAELPLAKAEEAASALWRACKNTLLIIEPGTPQGFARIHLARTTLIAQGAHLIAPCTHMKACPILAPDWCHFSVRLARSRDHMHAKKAAVPFEDEKFSYVMASCQPVTLGGARVLAPPVETKADIRFKLCAENGLSQQTIARRDKAEYKRVRKLEWGDLFE